MFLTTEHRNGAASTHEMDTVDVPANGTAEKSQAPVNGRAENRVKPTVPVLPAVNGAVTQRDARPVLGLFCYQEPASSVGRFALKMAAALAARGTPVHLFTPHAFPQEAPDVTVHVLGAAVDGDLLDQVQEFTRRACNAFLQQFQSTSRVTLMGMEWSSIQALSILRGIKNLDLVLSLHSLERQRSDLTSPLSQRIEEIELSGLREAKTIVVHEAATAEVARYWVPDCADRITCLRQMFAVEPFNSNVDAGAVKGRYQVGPVDPTILFVGDLSERYGPDLLIKAMPAILKNHRQARLIIAGEGSLYWPLRVYTRYLLLEHAVRLVGNVEGQAMHELVQAADVIAVPSREATPWWPILAGWAAGRPVMATHAAAPALLEHDVDGELCYPIENSCVWGIERVLYDDQLGRRLAQRGLQKLDDRFGWKAVAAQVEALLGVAAAR